MAILIRSDKTKRVRKYPAGTLFARHKWDDKVVRQGSKYRQLATGARIMQDLAVGQDTIPVLKLSLDSMTSANYAISNSNVEAVDLDMPSFTGVATYIVVSEVVRKIRLNLGNVSQFNRGIDGSNVEEIDIEGGANTRIIINFVSNNVRKLWRLRIDSLESVVILSYFCRNACLDKPSILGLCEILSRRVATSRITLDVGFCNKYRLDTEVNAAIQKAAEKNVSFSINWNTPPEDVRAKAELEPVVTE